MPVYPTPITHFLRLLFLLLLAGGLSNCARRNFAQADARVGTAAASPLPQEADSVLATAGRHYDRHGRVYHWFMGRHYRAVWAAPVLAPILNLKTAAPGGLQAGKVGGGYQSISMTLNGAQGRKYALRALDKEPSKTLPGWLRRTFLLNVVRDATAAANPYAALTVPPLAAAAGVAHARPRLVYVRPDAADLGPASERFRGKLALLEEKFESPADLTPDLAGARTAIDGEDMLKNVYDNPAYRIDQPAFLRARLLDVLIGDWDRHEGQWQWAEFRQPQGHVLYRGIPKDRDQVYFRLDDGLVPWLAGHVVATQFQTFKPKYGNVKALVYQARFIDQRGLSHLTRADFQRTARDLQSCLTDSVLARAARCFPPAVYALEGPRLQTALRARRDALPQAAEEFYRSLARCPTLGGTAQPERFVVRRFRDSTTVTVYSPALTRLGDGDSLRFRRTYFAAETREIILDGLGSSDVFDIATAPGGQRLRLQLYGGEGQDRVRRQGSGRRIIFYDEDAGATAANDLQPHLPRKNRRAYNRLNDD
ncbi:hypothetical protein Q5H93_02650 [Hymenobacter sp. ASUV-10]|uniref:GWxTD domain-containing protein n=1 Tax=Hymenobacter aranciens TaxID=3063996 RepID=A0ABT9B640_9BACT|nr:hypothetical protein [Hymenobacter sp. ASUV-10]MDO7873617.1 hypothetical protein [Hymenobacter sp. ASUV-10]